MISLAKNINLKSRLRIPETTPEAAPKKCRPPWCQHFSDADLGSRPGHNPRQIC